MRFETKKSLGQHFLTSAVVPGWMCDAAHIQAGDIVLEIGPGTGVLTDELLKRHATVVALEADLRAIEVLGERFAEAIAQKRLYIQHSDVREMDLASIPLLTDHAFKVVANIPYYLSGLLFREMLQTSIQPSQLVFLVQKEVAKRIATSSSGDKESLLSLSVKAFGTPSYIRTVSSGHFSPPPKVDSGIIHISDIHRDNFKDLDVHFFFEILHKGFGQKRKQLLGNLSQSYDRTALMNIFSTIGIPLTIRAEDIPLHTWLVLIVELSRLPSPHSIG